ncbi:hypothetical protein HHL22_15620 [Hymenobacter sp. RP-2-7]|uniref:Uncharacterized protein n=1 Tax=Hymenobacter polaris TaxID=2682546 RepID=A0A7Y0AGF1_9BACT|nr:hypothetical protein [Hymenobacter polaris]NML66635.1 hypothetical protein [Hymenobacter polaris]
MRHLLFLGGWLAASVARAQAPTFDDHLVPPRSALALGDDQLRYRGTIRHLLLPDKAAQALVQVVVLPSFAPEYSLTIERTGPTYLLTYRLAKRSIWQASAPGAPANLGVLHGQGATVKPPSPRAARLDSAAIATRQLLLPPQLAQALVDVCSVALAQMRYPVQEPLRVDGTRLLISTVQPNIGYRSGEAFDPAAADSRLAALIQLVAGLRELAISSDQLDFQQDILLTAAQRLLIQLAAR